MPWWQRKDVRDEESDEELEAAEQRRIAVAHARDADTLRRACAQWEVRENTVPEPGEREASDRASRSREPEYVDQRRALRESVRIMRAAMM